MTAAAHSAVPTTMRPLPWWKTHWRALVVIGLFTIGFSLFRPRGDGGRARALAVMDRPGVTLVNVGARLESAKFELHPGVERQKGNLGWTFQQLARFPEVVHVETEYFMRVNLSTLRQLPNLKTFAVNRQAPELEDDDLSTFRSLPALESLAIIGEKITPMGVKHFEGLTRLKSLKLSGQMMVGEGFESVSRIPNLETLVIEGGRGEWKKPFNLGPARKLKKLKFEALGAKAEDLVLTSELESLEEIAVEHVPLDKPFFRRLLALPNLKVLKIRGCARGLDDCMEEVARLPKLEAVFLADQATRVGFKLVTSRGLQNLARSNSLRELFIFGAPIGDEGVKEIAAMQRLRKLTLYEVKLTENSFEDIVTMPSLEQVFLSERVFTTRAGVVPAVERLSEALKNKKVELNVNRGWWTGTW